MDEEMPFFMKHWKQNVTKRKSSSPTSSDTEPKKIAIKKRCSRPLHERSDTQALNNGGEEQLRSGNSRLLTDFTVIRTIGKGGYGNVLQVINNIDRCVYAIKRIKLKGMENQKETVKEVELLSRLQHKLIVRYYSAFIDEVEETAEFEDDEGSAFDTPSYTGDSNCNISPGTLYEAQNAHSRNGLVKVLCIQMEYCENTLADAINNYLWKEHSKAWRMFWEIVEGLEYLHKNFVIHRDLKPLNIFLDATGRIKIGDFGLATKICRDLPIDDHDSQSLSGGIGTSYYRAPELNSGSRARYGQKVDIYSLGIILFEMFNPPFSTSHERHDVLTQLRNPDICMPKEFLDDQNNHGAISLLRWLLKHDASSRPTSKALVLYRNDKESLCYDLFQLNIMMERNNPFHNKIPNTESKHDCAHSI